MDKIYEHLKNFRDDILEPNVYDIDKDLIRHNIGHVHNKYSEFKTKNDINESVNELIKNIYKKKKDNTEDKYSNIAKTIIMTGY